MSPNVMLDLWVPLGKKSVTCEICEYRNRNSLKMPLVFSSTALNGGV
jgi:hypothetical protein